MQGLSGRARHARKAVEGAVLLDQYRLARRHVADQLEAQGIEGHALRGDQIVHAALGFRLAEHQRTDTEGIAKGQQAVTGDHRHHGVGTATAAMHAGHGGEDGRRVEVVVGGGTDELVGEHVQQNLRVGVRVDVAQVLAKQRALELVVLVRLPLWPSTIP